MFQIDGKIANLLTGTSSTQRCPLCKKTQSQFNKKNVNFNILNDFVHFGLSTLHFGINSVKMILKLAAQIDIKVHRCTKKSGNQKKREIQAAINSDLLWKKLSIETKDWFNVDGKNYCQLL